VNRIAIIAGCKWFGRRARRRKNPTEPSLALVNGGAGTEKRPMDTRMMAVCAGSVNVKIFPVIVARLEKD
jgi:hypothetical protein